MSGAFNKLETLRPIVLTEGITARAVNGERMTMAVVDLAPNAVSPEHSHENEQLGFVIRGSMTMRVGNEVLELHAGDTYVIPSEVEHGAAAGPDGCTVTDVFVPIRADWETRDRLEPKPGDWP
jgi:quercetin dioxygenase-like cupin family protein